jgi:hypothetical protein
MNQAGREDRVQDNFQHVGFFVRVVTDDFINLPGRPGSPHRAYGNYLLAKVSHIEEFVRGVWRACHAAGIGYVVVVALTERAGENASPLHFTCG